ncbi:Structural maintenance of chromosomes protein 6 [Chytriomyces hyalinus]|nr:Structural maintenance of chromosomes protein 6 [Chytriomyces hyalinus]
MLEESKSINRNDNLATPAKKDPMHSDGKHSRKRTRAPEADEYNSEPDNNENLDEEDAEFEADAVMENDFEEEVRPSQNTQSTQKRVQKKARAVTKLSAKDVIALPSLTGKLASISLYQFMCHQHLEVDFEPRINFVIGHNGSGKSAILTGIMVCLGGKANVTERASSIKSLVMEGKNVASVSISIHNRGPEAFKPEVYGQTITIERKILRDGSGSYKIMDANGETKANKKEELTAILDHMSISIDNPLSILTQDKSRQFLANSSPSDKYDFFSKGTLLAQISTDHSMINDCIVEATNGYAVRSSFLPGLKKEFKEAQVLWENVKKFEHLENEIDGLKNLYAWSIVEEKEKALHHHANRHKTLEKKMDQHRAKIAEFDGIIALNQERIGVNTGFLEAFEAEGKPIAERFEKLKAEIAEQRERKTEFEVAEREALEKLSAARKARDQMQLKINDEARKLGAVDRNARERKLSEIENIQAERVSSTARMNSLNEEIDRLETERNTIESDSRNANEQFNRIRNDINLLKDQIRHFEKSGYDRLSAYGPSMQKVLNEINAVEQRGGWKDHKPIGPLGLFINLRNPEFKRPIEAVLGQLLKSFVVASSEDRIRLNGILRDQRCQSNVLMQDKRQIHQLSEPDQSVLTFYRAMEIQDVTVRNQLIIHRNIEKLALVQSKHEGDTLACSGPNRSMPQNINTVYTADNVSIGGRGGGLQTKAGTDRPGGMPLLGVDVSLEISERQDRAARLQQDLGRAQQAQEQATRALNRMGDSIRQLSDERRQIMRRMSDTEHQLRKLEEDLIEEEPGAIGAYEESKREAELEMEGFQVQLDGIRESLKAASVELNSLQRDANQFKKELDALKQKHEAKQREIKDINDQKHLLLRDKADVEARLHQLEATDSPNLLAEIKGMQEEVDVMIEKSMELTNGKRFDTNGITPEAYKRQIRTKELQLRENMSVTGTKEEVALLLSEKERAFREAKIECDGIDGLLQELKVALEARMTDWAKLRKSITVRAKNTFSLMMQKRGFQAQLIIDHGKQTLDLRVDVHNLGLSKSKDKDKDPKTLSGGEKSFSTVCLLLSLWENMGNPFRALDEFDVFMDAVNRRISMQNMIQFARSGKNPCQYIFITPQDMSHVPDINGSDIRVHRLRDPERNQTRLNFERV